VRKGNENNIFAGLFFSPIRVVITGRDGHFFATFEISLAVLGIGAMNKTVWHIGTM